MRLPMQQDEEIAKLLVGTMLADRKKKNKKNGFAGLVSSFCNRMNIRFLGNAFHFLNVLELLLSYITTYRVGN